ncbi:MAG: protease family protein [Patescibacteria group bacterium]|nr:protease family protein [Patescibacteria group bacterium]
MNLEKIRNSKFGWALGISLFAVWFFFVVSFVVGLLILPIDLFAGNKDLVEVTLAVILPVILVVGSILMYRLFFFADKKESKLKDIMVGLGFRLPKRNVWWLTPLVLVGYIVLLVAALGVLATVAPNVAEQEQEVANTVKALGGWYLVVMVIGVGILTPIAEETFFRGLLIQLYGKKLKIAFAIVAPALLFGFAHMQVNVGVDTFIFGCALGWLTWKTQSIYPAIGLHLLKNLLALSNILS